MNSTTNTGGLKLRLTILNFLEFAIWGAYLTCMSRYLITAGLGDYISYFYSVQGFVSLFMPALMGIVADRWIQAQKTLSLCQFIAGVAMCAVALYGNSAGANANFGILFTLYTISVAFFMPTIALTNSVAYAALEGAGEDTVKAFPPIRVWGTVGFIVTMLCVDWTGLQDKPWQFAVSGGLSIIMAFYALTMPACPTSKGGEKRSLVDALGLKAFTLFKQRKMAIFFIFSMLLGSALQITNGYANPFIASFGAEEAFANTFGVQHANTLISLSQISETLCILLIPFFLKRFGIKIVMLMSMFAWVLRFGFFAVGDPGFPGVVLLILSMIVYGVAFDFFNISGSLFVDQETDLNIRSSAQGLFMMMTNGFGASIGMLLAGEVVNHYTHGEVVNGEFYTLGDWSTCWYIFAGYALVVAVLFAILFKYKHQR
ncbi:MAG: MFS transporter [Bacteroidaceae bacterium]|nr:MFS transporter [Bacteroidaceae bacterium]MBR1379404.1 MFS transporter [Bacteroidaceae bacterium]MBR1379909.1 MFS transporter [Bacteroidaceae bacterium]